MGVEMVMPSVDSLRIWSTPLLTLARSSRSRTRTPSQRVELMYGPPTSLLTQLRVMSCSIIGMASRSLNDSVNGCSTWPLTSSFQSATSIRGITRAVSTR